MTSKTKIKGDISESKILAHLIERGFSVSIPFGENQRYDMILDTGKELLKIQCKTGNYKDKYITFPTCSTFRNSTCNIKTSYVGDIDYFACYCPDNNKIYLLHIDEAPKREARLRITAPINGHKARFAKDYEIDKILALIV